MWNPLSNPELVSQLPGSPNSHEPLTHDGDSGLEINQEPRAAPSLSAFYKEEPFLVVRPLPHHVATSYLRVLPHSPLSSEQAHTLPVQHTVDLTRTTLALNSRDPI